jgi:hypothetical protein
LKRAEKKDVKKMSRSKIVVDFSDFQCYIIYVRRGGSPRSKNGC